MHCFSSVFSCSALHFSTLLLVAYLMVQNGENLCKHQKTNPFCWENNNSNHFPHLCLFQLIIKYFKWRVDFFDWFLDNGSLREKCPNTELFWSVFSRIQSKYEKIRTRKTPYLDLFAQWFLNGFSHLMILLKVDRMQFLLHLYFLCPFISSPSNGYLPSLFFPLCILICIHFVWIIFQLIEH